MSLAAWRLSSGPIPLTFLSTYIQDALSAAHPDFDIELDDTILTWGGWERALDIRVLNVQVIDPMGSVIASVPELSMSISGQALMRGIVAPERIEIFHPTLRLLRLRDGSFQVAFGEGRKGGEALAPGMLERMLADPTSGNAMTYLARIDIIDADLTIEDQRLETSWRASSAQLHLRRDSKGILGQITLRLDVEGHTADVAVLGEYHVEDRTMEADISFADLRPALFARLDPLLDPFSALQLPLSGKVHLALLADGSLEAARFQFSGRAGDLVLPAPLSQTLRAETLDIKGWIDGTNDSLNIENLTANFGSAGRLHLPLAVEHEMPLRELTLQGRYLMRDRRLDISKLELDLQGPRLRLEGVADGIGSQSGMTLQAKGELTDIKVDELATYWPRTWGEDAYLWCVENLSDGVVPRAEAEIALRLEADGKAEIVSLSGEMDMENVTVNYLSPMPKATQVSGKSRFNDQRFDIMVSHAEVGGLAVREGTVFLTGLDQVDQFADIELFIDGPIRSAMALIEHKPLDLVSEVGIDPEKMSGMVSTRLNLDFIIEKDLTIDRVDVAAKASTRDTFVAGVVLGRNLSSGNLELQIDKGGMDVVGDADLAGVPSHIRWRRNFGSNAPVISHYEVTSRIENVEHTEDLGVELKPFAGDMRGAASTKIYYTEFRGGRGSLKASADLTELAVDLPMIGWHKEAGVGGRAEVGLSVQDGVVRDIDHFLIQARDLTVSGSARYSPAGTGLERVDLAQVVYGRTDIKGALIPNEDGSWTVTVHGASLDFAPPYEKLFRRPGQVSVDEGTGIEFSLAVDLENVWLGETQRVRNLTGSLSRRGGRWRTLRMEGTVGNDKPFSVRILPGTGGNRTLGVSTQDAGALFRALGIYENMVGGSLEIGGVFDDTKSDSPIKGNLTIKQYRIINAPVLAHLVSMAAITGILDSLKGDGLGFLRLDVPFTMSDGVIGIKEAKSSGISLGFTASGKIYTAADAIEMKGTLVPAYAINAVWGNIPIFGGLLTGGEEGSGVFAARYHVTGSIEDPKVQVDPLSALAPGFLRNLFDVFREGDAGKQAPSPKPDAGKTASPIPADDQAPVGGL